MNAKFSVNKAGLSCPSLNTLVQVHDLFIPDLQLLAQLELFMTEGVILLLKALDGCVEFSRLLGSR